MARYFKFGYVTLFGSLLSLSCGASEAEDGPFTSESESQLGSSNSDFSESPTTSTDQGSPSASPGTGLEQGNGLVEPADTGLGQPPSGVDDCNILPVIYRDFRGNGELDASGAAVGHPDFELSSLYPAGGSNWPSDKYGEPVGSSGYKGLNEAGEGLVARLLGADLKPVFESGLGKLRLLEPARNPNNSPQVFQSVVGSQDWNWNWTPPNVIKNAASFADWYASDPAGIVNQELSGWVKLEGGVFESSQFFPLDGAGFGNTPGQEHNYHFTTEAHVKFTYVPGMAQRFEFQGDDDLWIFINGRLAMDLGGVHEPMLGIIDFDTQAEALELDSNVASQYTMDIFHAERQTGQSNFKVTTNIACFEAVIR